jgi:tetratricopeptide (TPR) repeat protein
MLSRHVEVNAAVRARPAGDFTSYETVLKGMMHFRNEDPGGLDAAASYFRRALEISPHCAEAMRGLSAYHVSRWLCRLSPDDLGLAVEYGRRGSDIDPTNADCLASLGLAQVWASGVDAAAPAIRRALEINPGDPYVLADASVHAIYDGRIADARTLLATANRLNPIPPRWFVEYRALLDFSEGRYAESARGFSGFDTGQYQMAYHVAGLALAGDLKALAVAMADIRHRGWDLTAVPDVEPYRDPAMRERLREGLRRALAA